MTHRHVRSFVTKLAKRGYEPSSVRGCLVQVGTRTITVVDASTSRAPIGSDLVAWWQNETKRADGGSFVFRDRLGRRLEFDELFPMNSDAKDRRFVDFGSWKQAIALMGGQKEGRDGGDAGTANRGNAEEVELP